MRDILLALAESFGAAVTGVGTQRSRKIGRLLVSFAVVLNLGIFVANVRWLMHRAESFANVPSGQPIDLRPKGYGRGVATFVGKLFMAKDVEARLFNIDAATGDFVPTKFQRPKPDKFFQDYPVIVTGVSSTTMTDVRHLVGSIHFWHPELKVRIYDIGALTERHRSEISLWEGVTLVNGLDALGFAVLDPDVTIGHGPIGKVQEDLRQYTEDITGGNLPPSAEAELKMLLLGGRLDMAPALVYHAVRQCGVAIYLDHTAHTRGWIDNVLKALMRDGEFFVQEETTQGGCNPVLQGYHNRSNLTESLLRRHLLCSLGGTCPTEELASLRADEKPSLQNWWGLRPDAIEGMKCHDAHKSKISTEESLRQLSEEGDQAAHVLVGVQYHCRLKRRAIPPEVIFESKLGSDGRSISHGFQRQAERNVIRIALGVPSATGGTQLTTPDLLPVLNVLLPSLLGTIDKNTDRFWYTLYLGYDLGDQMYDTEHKQKRLQKRMTTLVGEYPLEIKLLRFNVSLSTTYVWNGLLKKAMDEGADYFFACHDDTEFYPSQGSYWSDVMVASLRDNVLGQNFGVASPLDMRDPTVVTHAFVHRTHYDVFGELFPAQLSNWEHADWISRVYGYKNTFLHTGIQVYNTHRFTGRSMPCKTRKELVDHEVYMGADKIKMWALHNLGHFTTALHSDTTGIKS